MLSRRPQALFYNTRREICLTSEAPNGLTTPHTLYSIMLVLNIFFSTALIIFIFIRPFIGSGAFPAYDLIYSCGLIILSAGWLLNNRRSLKLHGRPLWFFILAFLAAILIATVHSLNIQRSLMQLHKYIYSILVFFAVANFTPRLKRILMLSLVLTAGLVSLQAILWLFYGAPALVRFLNANGIYYNFATEFLSRGRAFIPFILPAVLGGYLIMALPISIAYSLTNYKNRNTPFIKRPITNSLLLIPVILIFSALILTKAISPVVSLAGAFLIFSGLQTSRIKNQRSMVPFLFMVILAVILIVRSHNVGYWQNPIFSLGQRRLYWHNTWLVIKQFPLFGIGPGNMPFVGSRFSHNSYLQLWAETGIFGLAAFLGIAAATLKRCLPPGGCSDKMFNAFYVANLAFLLHNITDFTFFLPEVSLLWWIAIALLDNAGRQPGEGAAAA